MAGASAVLVDAPTISFNVPRPHAQVVGIRQVGRQLEADSTAPQTDEQKVIQYCHDTGAGDAIAEKHGPEKPCDNADYRGC